MDSGGDQVSDAEGDNLRTSAPYPTSREPEVNSRGKKRKENKEIHKGKGERGKEKALSSHRGRSKKRGKWAET